jgi:hypothetical protein
MPIADFLPRRHKDTKNFRHGLTLIYTPLRCATPGQAAFSQPEGAYSIRSLLSLRDAQDLYLVCRPLGAPLLAVYRLTVKDTDFVDAGRKNF